MTETEPDSEQVPESKTSPGLSDQEKEGLASIRREQYNLGLGQELTEEQRQGLKELQIQESGQLTEQENTELNKLYRKQTDPSKEWTNDDAKRLIELSGKKGKSKR